MNRPRRGVAATAVVVHGAWHGAWCFDRVLPLLEEAAVPVVAIDLPGHGDDSGPLTDLHGDAERVRTVLDGIDDEVVLLGHSYGGAVITEAGAHPSVAHLVFLCAFPLEIDESCMAAAVAQAADFSHDGRPNLAEAFVDQPDGSTRLEPAGAAACLYNDCDADTVAWALARLGPHPMANLGQAPAAVAWRERPSTYVVCAADNAVHPDLQRLMAKRCTASVEWETSHSPFASQPALLADLLIALAAT